MARILHEFHVGMRELAPAWPLLQAIVDSVEGSLGVLDESDLLSAEAVRALRSEQEDVMALEESCRGPVEWDLAVLRHSNDGVRALEA